MSEGIWLAIIGIVSSVVTAIITFLLTKKKYYSEVDSNVINNMKESLEFYKKLSDDNRARLDDVLERNKKLENEVDDLRKIVFGMFSQICTDIMCQSRKIDINQCPYYLKGTKAFENAENNEDDVK